MAEENPDGRRYRTDVIVALVGLVGVLATALISNWDKLFPTAPQREAVHAPAVNAAPADDGAVRRAAEGSGAAPRRSAEKPDPRSASRGQQNPTRADPPPVSQADLPAPSTLASDRANGAAPGGAPTAPARAPAVAAVCDGTSSFYRAEATIRQTASERAVTVTLKLTNVGDRPLVIFGAATGPEFYGRLLDDSESNVYDVYADTTTAPRPPGNTPDETAAAYARRPEGGKHLDARQTIVLEYTPMKKFGQQWRPPTKYTFKVGVWVLAQGANGYEARGDSLSCEVPVR